MDNMNIRCDKGSSGKKILPFVLSSRSDISLPRYKIFLGYTQRARVLDILKGFIKTSGNR